MHLAAFEVRARSSFLLPSPAAAVLNPVLIALETDRTAGLQAECGGISSATRAGPWSFSEFGGGVAGSAENRLTKPAGRRRSQPNEAGGTPVLPAERSRRDAGAPGNTSPRSSSEAVLTPQREVRLYGIRAF